MTITTENLVVEELKRRVEENKTLIAEQDEEIKVDNFIIFFSTVFCIIEILFLDIIKHLLDVYICVFLCVCVPYPNSFSF